MSMRLAALLAGSVLALLAAGSAEAATARASDPVTIYEGPGYDYQPVGRLARNEVVQLAQCTPSGRWCYVLRDGAEGWVLASYLIGSPAKVEATPWRPLVTPGWGLLRPRHWGW